MLQRTDEYARLGSASLKMPLLHKISLAVVIATLPILLHVHGVAGSVNGPRLDVTSLFSLETNSTCGGDPPTLFESSSGELLNCSLDEHNSSFAADGDPNTWWQSQNGDDPVAFTFSLLEASTYLSLVWINLYVAHFPPQIITLEVRPRGSSEYSMLQAYVLNDQNGLCEEFENLGVACSNYSVGAPDSSGNTNITGLSCPMDASLPVEEFRLITSGFLPDLSPEGQYHSLAEVEIFATIARGYFARSLHSIVAEGETGRRMDSGARVEIGRSSVTLPGFSFRGYAQLEFGTDERVLVQWIFPYLPQTTNYRFIVRYRNLGNSRRLVATVSQSGTVVNTRVTFIRDNDCVHPCYAALENPAAPQNPEPVDFSLNDQDPVTITMTLSSTNILIDSIIALPEEFFNPSNFSNIDYMRFMQECTISNGELRSENSLSNDFCIESAIQLSLDFFCATPACDCESPGSIGQDCELYGGQCTCIEAEVEQGFSTVLGRQCSLCPFYSFLTPDGCTPCSCPVQLDNCDMTTGQCSNCPPLVEGRTCNACVANSFGDPSVGCTRCDCNDIGSQSCNSTTGECNCKIGVSGMTCDLCTEGWFNFTSTGCVNCDCDNVGSERINCSISGQCTCKPGVGGLKCSDCDVGFFGFSSTGCQPCNCSGRTSDCQLSPSSMETEYMELCQCPFPYTGDSCELCIDGYYLSSQTGNCELCQCSGKTDTCEDGTGDCIDCGDNTTGVNCDECLNGFYDVDIGVDLECQPCPCTTTTAFNISCRPDMSGNPECFCRPGHERPLCDSCSHGYFGSPPDLRCRSCDCNSNINPDVPGSCDRETGLCLMCINNSTGPECELCVDGYYGDATLQNCQPCNCDVGGSVESNCNSSGHCNCLDGVGGLRCDGCLRGYWNFSDGLGCSQCMCAGGSVSSECDVVSGICRCNEGVGGDDCSICLDGYFNFTNDGCTNCGCGVGAVNPTCSSEGLCSCQPGVVGDKCDQCESYHTNLSPTGCQPCSQCVQNLRGNLTLTGDEQEFLLSSLMQFISLQQANASGYEEVLMLIQLLQDNVTATDQYLNDILFRLDTLNSAATEFTVIINSTKERVTTMTTVLNDLSPYAGAVHEHIVEVSNNVQNIQINTGQTYQFANSKLQSIQDILVIAQVIAANASEVAAQHNGNYSTEIYEAMQSLNKAEQVNMNAQSALTLVQIQQEQSQNLTSDYQYLNDSLELLLLQTNDLNNRKNDLKERLFSINMTTELLKLNLPVIDYTVIFATDALNDAEQIVRQAEYALIMVMEDVRTLAMLVGHSVDVSTLSSGDGSALFSGSGIPDLESSLPTPEPVPDTIVGGVELLRRTVVELEGMFIRCSGVIQLAMNYASNVSVLAYQINSTLTPSLTSGNRAVEAIIDYDESIAIIQAAFNLIIEANETVNSTLVDINDLLTNSLATTTARLLNISMDLLSEAEQLYDTVRGLLPAVERAREAYERAENQTQEIANLVIMLTHDVNELVRAVSTNGEVVDSTISMIQERLDLVEEIYDSATNIVPILEQNVTSAQLQLNETQMTLNDADGLLESANGTALDAWEAFTNRSLLINDITSVSRNNQLELEALNSSIDSLQLQLQRAMQAAASIDLALRFYGNSTKSFSVPNEVAFAPFHSTTISMVFQPEELSSGLMFAVRESLSSEGVALRVDSGSVLFEYHSDSSIHSLNVSSIREEQWYQLYASIDTDALALSVAPLQGDGATMMEIRNFSSLTPLSLSSEDVILLGGAESLEEVGSTPIASDGFSGCLDRVVINNAQLSLLLPNEMDRDIVTCTPRPPAELPRPFESGIWLQGSESLILTNISTQMPLNTESFEMNFSFRTFTSDGILIYLTDFTTTHYLLVYFNNGQVVLNMSLTGLDFNQLSTTNTYNNGQWFNITVLVEESSITLTVDSEVINMDASFASTFDPSGIVSIGSPTRASATDDEITAQLAAALETIAVGPLFSATGCFRNLQLNEIMINISESALFQQMVSLNGCPAEVSDGVRFMGDGYAVFNSPVQTDESQSLNVSISFRGSQLAASLLNLPQVSISIFHTHLRVDVESVGLVLLSKAANLNNNQWHTITLSMMPDQSSDNLTVTELIVDGVGDSFLTEDFEAPVIVIGDPFIVGGSTNRRSVVVAEGFRGCVGEIIINDRVLNFVEAVEVANVALYGCRPPSLIIPVPPPPPPLPPPPSIRPETTVGLNGSDASFIALVVSEEDVLRGFSIVLEFQTASPEAVLLYLQGSVYADFTALQLRSGLLVFSYDLGSGRVDIESENSYNDGVIHTVQLRRFEQCGVMIIDGGVETQNGNSPGTFTALNINSGLLFLGSIPEFVNRVSLLREGFERPPGLLACFHALSINGVYESLNTTDIQAGTGFEQCMSSYNNIAYFGANSYSRIFNNFYAGKRFTFSMDIRTYNCSGILLYVATPLYSDHVLLELVNGKVRFVFDNGPGEEVIEYIPANNPTELCDGQWHSLIIEKDGETGYLIVDGGTRLSVTSLFTNFLAVNTNDPLYVGGVPESVRLRFTVQTGSFQGCINNFSLSLDGQEPQSVPFAQSTDKYNVELYVCRL